MEMTFLIKVSSEENRVLEKVFESSEFKYNFGEDKFENNLKKVILNLQDLINAKNQLDYLKELGVDNWSGYEIFDINIERD